MDKKVKVSVIIPTYKREQVLVDTIKSVLKQKFVSFELIVVDQTLKHSKKTEEFLSNIKSKLKYFKVTPPSLPAARNFGLQKAEGEIVIFIDDDVLLDPGFIKAHFDSYEKKEVMCVAGRIVQSDKPVSDTLMFFRKTSFGAGSFNYLKFSYAQTAQGCNMSFRKKKLLQIGGFDTNYIGNAIREESDVCFKLREMGYKILFNPKASLFHLFYQSGGCREESSVHDNYIIYRNEMLFFLRHRPLIYFPFFFVGYLINYVINLQLIEHGKVFLRIKVFAQGLLTGFLIFLFPRKSIVAQEIS